MYRRCRSPTKRFLYGRYASGMPLVDSSVPTAAAYARWAPRLHPALALISLVDFHLRILRYAA